MGMFHSPNAVTSSLVATFDPANARSYKPYSSLINTSTWTTGAGGVGAFGQNGDTVENERVLDTDPFGNTSIVWETRTTGDNNADGGWNNGYYSIDPTVLYRFSVWMRRTSSTSGGVFYLGLYGNGSVWGVERTDNGVNEGNPYWECAGTSKYTQNQWYLVVGHCYPYTQAAAIRHADTGIFTITGGTTKVLDVNGCNIGNDPRWLSSTSSTLHRVYHYYCTDSTTRLQFWAPRVDKCDGTQPTIADLLAGRATGGAAIVGTNTTKASFQKDVSYISNDALGVYDFDGTQDSLNFTMDLRQDWSFECWVKKDVVSGFCFLGQGGYALNQGLHIWHYNDTSLRFGLYGNDVDATGLSTSTGVWYHYVFTYSHSSPYTKKIYRNGVELSVSTVSGPAQYAGTGIVRIGSIYSSSSTYANGKFGLSRIYNKVLSASEVEQNFNATRARYGI